MAHQARIPATAPRPSGSARKTADRAHRAGLKAHSVRITSAEGIPRQAQTWARMSAEPPVWIRSTTNAARLTFGAEYGRFTEGCTSPCRRTQASHRSIPAGRSGAAVGPQGERKKFSLLLTTRCLGQGGGGIPPRAEGATAWQWAAAPKGGFHVLRHTYASIMWEAGESVVTLARWLGHSSPAITLGYYAHFMPEAGSKGRGTIDGLLGERGRSACQPKLPRFSPALSTRVPGLYAPEKPSVDCKVEEMGGLGKCCKRS
ncbi:tyrosine-type recombinase/integrase [Streptomyces sp. NPDC053541]|uniref:tyrosine-type recombinase/integrase n=1 Tax=Streptomyces sp. NPDC053541 TaxID=3365709 RepID=UPI0037D592F9